MKKTNNVFSSQYPSGIAFVGALITGLGVGILADNLPAYGLIGAGVGFILVAIISTTNRNRYLDR